MARYSGSVGRAEVRDQPLAFELRVRVVAFDGQPRRCTGGLLRIGQHLAVADRPLRDVDGLLRVLAFHDRHDVVRVDDERVAIGQYRFAVSGSGPRARGGRRRPRAWLPHCFRLGAPRPQPPWLRSDRSRRSAGIGARVAIDPHVWIRVTARVLVARVQASMREKSSLNRPSHTSLCAAAAPHLVRAALVVGTAERDEARMVRPPRMIDLGSSGSRAPD